MGFGAEREITIYDPTSREIVGPEIDVTGNPPPKAQSTVWPWVIGAGVLAALWWITRDERNRPLARAGG